MSDDPGPWGRLPPAPAPPQRPPRSRRLIVAVAIAGCAALGAWALARMHPEVSLSTYGVGRVASLLAMVVLVSASLLARGLKAGQAARYGLIWLGVAAVLLVGFSFRDEIGSAFGRVRSELAPDQGVATGQDEIALSQDSDGGFHVMGAVNGVPVRFLVDTGASDIVLSPADARRIGVDPGRLSFTDTHETANGTGRGARFQAATLSVGPIRRADVAMSINQAPMSTSLLGMVFLRSLASFEVKGHRLYLRMAP